MKKKIGLALILVLAIALGISKLGCSSTIVNDTAINTTTTEVATTTSAVINTTTTTGAKPTSTSTSTSTTSSASTTIFQSFTVSGIIYQNECASNSATVHMNAGGPNGDSFGASQIVTFINGTAEYSVVANEVTSFIVISLVGDKPPLYFGGVGVTTGDAAVAESQFKIYNCIAGVVTSESGQDFNMYTFIDSKKKP